MLQVIVEQVNTTLLLTAKTHWLQCQQYLSDQNVDGTCAAWQFPWSLWFPYHTTCSDLLYTPTDIIPKCCSTAIWWITTDIPYTVYHILYTIMDKVLPWCGQPSDRGWLKNHSVPSLNLLFISRKHLNRAHHAHFLKLVHFVPLYFYCVCLISLCCICSEQIPYTSQWVRRCLQNCLVHRGDAFKIARKRASLLFGVSRSCRGRQSWASSSDLRTAAARDGTTRAAATSVLVCKWSVSRHRARYPEHTTTCTITSSSSVLASTTGSA